MCLCTGVKPEEGLRQLESQLQKVIGEVRAEAGFGSFADLVASSSCGPWAQTVRCRVSGSGKHSTMATALFHQNYASATVVPCLCRVLKWTDLNPGTATYSDLPTSASFP